MNTRVFHGMETGSKRPPNTPLQVPWGGAPHHPRGGVPPQTLDTQLATFLAPKDGERGV